MLDSEISKSNTELVLTPRIKITEEDLSLIGKKVFKKSFKPFKSKLKYATVKGFVNHYVTGVISFYFHEDDSIVECRKCKLLS